MSFNCQTDIVVTKVRMSRLISYKEIEKGIPARIYLAIKKKEGNISMNVLNMQSLQIIDSMPVLNHCSTYVIILFFDR